LLNLLTGLRRTTEEAREEIVSSEELCHILGPSAGLDRDEDHHWVFPGHPPVLIESQSSLDAFFVSGRLGPSRLQ